MDVVPKVAADQFVESMRQDVETFLKDVVEAVNQAPDGAWIAGSEEPVRHRSAEFRRQVFEKAVQMRLDAAEAAFPPSTQPGHGQTPGQ